MRVADSGRVRDGGRGGGPKAPARKTVPAYAVPDVCPSPTVPPLVQPNSPSVSDVPNPLGAADGSRKPVGTIGGPASKISWTPA